MTEQGVVPEVVQKIVDQASGAAPENLQQVKERKLSKIDAKRQQIFMDRMSRKIASGMTQDQAMQAIAREDYEAMPIEKKVARLESMFSNVLQHMSQDIMTLKQNDQVIADAFDVNYRAIAKMFKKLNLSEDEQKALIDEARADVAKDREEEMKARMEAQKKAQEASEKARVEAEMKAAESKDIAPTEPVEPHIPDGATVFGG